MKTKLKPRGAPFKKGHPSYHTEAGLTKIRASAQSRVGIPITTEVRAKISAALIGKKLAKETIEKLRIAHTGKKQSPEAVACRAASRNGYRHSDETRAKIRATFARNRLGRTFKSTEIHRARGTPEYALWRETVFSRDAWTCQKCGITGGTIHAHHIRNFAEDERLRFSVANGITLCKADHGAFHRTYGIKNNTAEQLTEFFGK